MRVFVLGAGASRPAGMPLGPSLGRALRRFLGSSVRPDAEALATKWRELRTTGIFEDDFELDLTRLDIDSRRFFSRAREGEDVSLEETTLLRGELAQLLTDYFQSRERAVLLRPERIGYLRRFVRRHANPGDAFITLNYDCLLERALREEGLWNLTDGYGVSLASVYPELADELPSPCKGYKLHGSSGWLTAVGPPGARYGGPPELLLMAATLHNLGYPSLRYQGERAVTHSAVLPSFIKSMSLFPLPAIWKAAGEALANAVLTVVTGYSFPSADSAVRELLLLGIQRNGRLAFCWYKAGYQSIREIVNFFQQGGVRCRDRRATIGQLAFARNLELFIYPPPGPTIQRRRAPRRRRAPV